MQVYVDLFNLMNCMHISFVFRTYVFIDFHHSCSAINFFFANVSFYRFQIIIIVVVSFSFFCKLKFLQIFRFSSQLQCIFHSFANVRFYRFLNSFTSFTQQFSLAIMTSTNVGFSLSLFRSGGIITNIPQIPIGTCINGSYSCTLTDLPSPNHMFSHCSKCHPLHSWGLLTHTHTDIKVK